jgi:hypothetical protein
MRIALVNPAWEAEGPDTAACCGRHAALELLYAGEMLLARGLEARLFDAPASGLGPEELVAELIRFDPTDIFFTTAPGYARWREAARELGTPAAFCRLVWLAGLAANLICVGPHGSARPEETLLSLLCDAAVVGEPEEVIANYEGGLRGGPHLARFAEGRLLLPERPAEASLAALPALVRPELIAHRLGHRHLLAPAPDEPPAADVEFSRGCPAGCPACAGLGFRGRYRERPPARVLAELEALAGQGVGYVYFIDEVFGLGAARELLREMARRDLPRFGARSRLELWDAAGIELLAAAGCVSLELEAVATDLAREGLLRYAARRLERVQVALLVAPAGAGADGDEGLVERWRARLAGCVTGVTERPVLAPPPGRLGPAWEPCPAAAEAAASATNR